ncbi:MAG: MFS transporter [Fusobacteria bacterium]|nr:MFS transporter [Fusobacteriota bacterium]
MEFREEKKSLLFFVFAFAIMGNYCLDSFLPSVSNIAKTLSTDVGKIELGFALSAIGLAIGSFIFGMLTLKYGRRSLGLISLIVLIIGELFCTFHLNVEFFWISRIIVGIGAGALITIIVTILTEVFQGEEMVKYNSFLMLTIALLPAVSPFFGGLIQTFLGRWEYNFIIPMVLFIILFILYFRSFKEYKEVSQEVSINVGKIIKEYFIPFTELKATFAIVAGIFTLGSIFFYLTIGPTLFESDLHLTPFQYGGFSALNAVGFLCSSYLNIFLIKKGIRKIMIFGNSVALIAGILMIVLFFKVGLSILVIVGPSVLFIFGLNLVHINTLPNAIFVYKKKRGNIGATFIFIQTLFAAFFGIFASSVNIENQKIIGIVFVSTSIILFVIMSIIFHKDKGEVKQ